MANKKKVEELTELERLELLNELDAETDLALVSSEQKLLLKMPIKIRPTAKFDGYVITDSNNIEHFFYFTENVGELEYDGWSITVKDKTKK